MFFLKSLGLYLLCTMVTPHWERIYGISYCTEAEFPFVSPLLIFFTRQNFP